MYIHSNARRQHSDSHLTGFQKSHAVVFTNLKGCFSLLSLKKPFLFISFGHTRYQQCDLRKTCNMESHATRLAILPEFVPSTALMILDDFQGHQSCWNMVELLQGVPRDVHIFFQQSRPKANLVTRGQSILQRKTGRALLLSCPLQERACLQLFEYEFECIHIFPMFTSVRPASPVPCARPFVNHFRGILVLRFTARSVCDKKLRENCLAMCDCIALCVHVLSNDAVHTLSLAAWHMVKHRGLPCYERLCCCVRLRSLTLSLLRGLQALQSSVNLLKVYKWYFVVINFEARRKIRPNYVNAVLLRRIEII